jgi:ADP-ribose pyrophosphatase
MAEKTLSSEMIYQGQVISLRVDTVITADGIRKRREIVLHHGAVAMIAIDEQQNIMLVRQFRTPAGRVLLEIPAGTLEEGESPEAAVPRELREEIGYRPREILKLGAFYAAPGFCTEIIHLYLATGLIPDKSEADDTPEITPTRMPLNKAKKLIDDGTICDAKSVAGILLYLDYLARKSP